MAHAGIGRCAVAAQHHRGHCIAVEQSVHAVVAEPAILAVDLAAIAGSDDQGCLADGQQAIDVGDGVVTESGAGGIAGGDGVVACIGGDGAASAEQFQPADCVSIDQAIDGVAAQGQCLAVGLAAIAGGDGQPGLVDGQQAIDIGDGVVA